MNKCLLALLAAPTLAACSLFGGTDDHGGGDAPHAADAGAGPDVAKSTAPAPVGPSCRAIHEQFRAALSGTYALTSEGGTVPAYCDMDSYDGGWTLVTPAMIVEDKATQDSAPASPAQVEVARNTDAHGGIAYSLRTAIANCGTDATKPGPSHYFLVGELDDWTQIMASYEFSGNAACWDIFGSPKLPTKLNVSPFDRSRDKIGPETGMSRDAAGKAIPYDGRVTACDSVAANFWRDVYEKDPKSARVVLRRSEKKLPAGLAIAADCGLGAWKITSIFVR